MVSIVGLRLGVEGLVAIFGDQTAAGHKVQNRDDDGHDGVSHFRFLSRFVSLVST